MAHPRARIADLAARQHGVVATWQCRALGASARWVGDQVDRFGWASVHRGVHRVGGAPPSPQGDLWAALLATGEVTAARIAADMVGEGWDPVDACVEAVTRVAAVTGWSAAKLRGADRPWPAFPQVVAAHGTVVRGRQIRVVRTRMGTVPVEWVNGLPLAPQIRMLADAAWIGRRLTGIVDSVHDLAIVLDRTRQLPVDVVIGAVEEPSAFDLAVVPRPMRQTAERLRPGFSHSGVEAKARAIATDVAARYGLRVEPRPHPIAHGGRVLAEADIAIIELRWDVEVDGPHHDGPIMRALDARRDRRVGGIDWAVDRFTAELVSDAPGGFAAAVETALQRRLAAVGGRRAAA